MKALERDMDTLKQILNGKWIDPDTGSPIQIPIASVKIEAGIAKYATDFIAARDIGKKFTVVSDKNTHEILGGYIEKALGDKAYSVVFESGVLPDIACVNKVVEATKTSDAIIAVGSGTINDICKYASYLAKKPYAVFGTAPSMNGYSSANASIIVDGHKKTLKAHLPTGIFLDLDILSAAPKRLIQSGLGDSLCRSTAQSDWLLSHLLLGTPYKTAPFELLSEYEPELFANSKALVKGDREIMELLAKTLVLSGFGMYICGGSYPASQGEHLIAHTMEVVYGDIIPKTYHGEQIGVTTLTMARLQEDVLAGAAPKLGAPDSTWKENIIKFYGAEIGGHCIEEYAKKILTTEKCDEINHSIEQNWGDIVAQINTVSIEVGVLRNILNRADCPLTAHELGWKKDKYKATIQHAKYMRDRFTFLDLGVTP
jgi:glycerol-1-phosphate dehydrogenase [NAD(P)+]